MDKISTFGAYIDMKNNPNKIRKAKYLIFKNGIHRFIPFRKFLFLGYLGEVSKWIHQHRNLEFSTFPQKKFVYQRREELYQFILDKHIKDEPIDFFEFGVSRGTSFKWWVAHHQNPNSKFYGFDTFTGLPEDWGPFKKGAMSNGNEPPKIEDSRHEFYQGIFQQTLLPFLAEYSSTKRKVIHLDADLYSATLYVLTSMSYLIKPGDILLFDEFNVPEHEYKAFTEWADSFYIKYTVLGEINNYHQVAIRIE